VFSARLIHFKNCGEREGDEGLQAFEIAIAIEIEIANNQHPSTDPF
jgi:hypothetical protein